jgi:hypothetical protein
LKQAARFSVLDSDTACGETSYRILEIDLLSSESSKPGPITLNGNVAGWNTIGPTLRDLFSVRQEKFVYVRVGSHVAPSDYSEMSRLIEDAGAERLCLLDSKAPRKYVPQIIGGAQ